MAECNDARIVSAFRLAVGREPGTFECNAGRYAGGAYTSETELIPLVKASLVCSDPWVAQAYYKLSLPLNGHDPTQLEGNPDSTRDQCNFSIYGSWSNFAGLMQNVKAHFSPQGKPASGPALSATITGPQTMASAQPATITWTYAGRPTACGNGLDLVMKGGGLQNYVMTRIPSLSSRSATFQMLDWSRSFDADTQITLQLVDRCLGQPISPGYSTRLSVPRKLQPGSIQVTIQGVAVVLNLLQRILDIDGNLFDANGTIVGRRFYLDGASGLRSPDGLVASGGGNLVASGGGNVVLSGGTMSVISPNSANLQSVLAGRLGVESLMNPGNVYKVQSVGLTAVTISQFAPATAIWANRTTLNVSWNFAGAAAANQSVSVQLQAGGRNYNGCPATLVSNKGCQIPGADYTQALRTTTNGVLALLDAVTQKVLFTANITIRIL